MSYDINTDSSTPGFERKKMKQSNGDPAQTNSTKVGAVRQLDTMDDYTDNVDPKYVPEGFKSVDAFLEDMREEYQHDYDYDYENREDAIEDKKFAAGEQWDPAVLQLRIGLPCLTINSIPQFVAQVVGDWRQNRNSVEVVPNDDGNEDVAQIRGDLIRSIEMQSRASRVYDQAFESAIVSGDGAFRVAVEYAKDSVFDQDIFIRPIEDAQSVIWDRMSVDPTGRDARHVMVEDRIPKKEFNRKWPNLDPWHMNERFSGMLRAGRWFDDQAVKIVEYWRMIVRNRVLSLFEDGSVHVIDSDVDVDQLIQLHGAPVKTRTAPVQYAQMHLCTGFAILSGPYEYKLNRVPIIRVSGRVTSIQNRRVRYGMVRFMKDPARLRNFWRSVAAEQLGYAPKAQWIAPESAVTGREDEFRKAHMTRDPLLIYNDGAEAPPTRLEPPTPQMALLNEAQINTQDMKDVTGIQDASLGNVSNETSGTAILNRQREGDVANITYHDNGTAAVLEAGDVCNQLISQIYDGTRTVRLVGKDESIRLQRINDPMDPRSPDLAIGSYDTAIQTGPSFTTRRVEAAQAMMEAIQVAPQLMQIAGDLIVKAQNWPGADELADRLMKTIPPQFLTPDEQKRAGAPAQPPVDPQQFQQMQQQMQQIMMQNQELKVKHDVHMKQIAVDAYKAETERMRAENEAMAKIHAQTSNDMLQGIVTAQKDSHLYQQHAHDLTMEHFRQQGAQKIAQTNPVASGDTNKAKPAKLNTKA
ncbi:hypothetical protein KGP36_03005 [Patescibacteria group bacterium]|nr:hypothetical protein [Patescibacteria group bacterium]